MGRPVTPMHSLGEKVAAALDDDGGERDRAVSAAGRAFLSASLRAGPARRQRAGLWFAVASVCVAVIWTAWTSFDRPRAPLTFLVDGRADVAQTWLAAPSTGSHVLSFSDGTILEMPSRSQARVVSTDGDGAEVSLESGSIHAAVVHTAHSAWRVVAGPFTVRVTGTRFDLSWAPSAQELSLTVREGSVAVTGSIIGQERPVHAGEELLVAVTRGRVELIETVGDAVTPPVLGEPAIDADDRPAPGAGANDGSDPPAAPPARERSRGARPWRQLAMNGDLRAAFTAAEAQGFAGVCGEASSADLLLLGDAARLSGRADRAEEALLTLRRRYPRDSRRTAAAFALGKVAFDLRRDYSSAAQWFATSIHEQPSGPLAREAAGRRLEALAKAGDTLAASRAAADYLSAYPDGPHAAMARQISR